MFKVEGRDGAEGTENKYGKNKINVSGNKARERIQSGRWPCGCCGRGWEQTLCFVLNVINGGERELGGDGWQEGQEKRGVIV